MSYKTTDEAWRNWTKANVKKFKVSMYARYTGEALEYEAFAGNASPPAGYIRMATQPAYPASDDPRAGTKEAMAALDSKYSGLIQKACCIAVELARKNLTTHSRDVRREMAARGLVGYDGREFWLGRAFNKLAAEGIFKEVGRFKYSDETRNIHERNIALWALVDGADASKYPKLQKPEEK